MQSIEINGLYYAIFCSASQKVITVYPQYSPVRVLAPANFSAETLRIYLQQLPDPSATSTINVDYHNEFIYFLGDKYFLKCYFQQQENKFMLKKTSIEVYSQTKSYSSKKLTEWLKEQLKNYLNQLIGELEEQHHLLLPQLKLRKLKNAYVTISQKAVNVDPTVIQFQKHEIQTLLFCAFNTQIK